MWQWKLSLNYTIFSNLVVHQNNGHFSSQLLEILVILTWKIIFAYKRVLYGRPEFLIRSQIAEMRRIYPIDDQHLDRIMLFSIKINNLATFLKSTNNQQHLVNPMLMDELLEKLPTDKRLDWVKYSISIQKCPTVIDFSTWLNQIAQLICKMIPTTIINTNNNMNMERNQRVN